MGLRVKTDKRFDNFAPSIKNRKMKTPALKMGTWNVRTMTPGFSDDLLEISDARKTAAIDIELSRLRMDIVALQETRLAGSGSVRERDNAYWNSAATTVSASQIHSSTRSSNTESPGDTHVPSTGTSLT